MGWWIEILSGTIQLVPMSPSENGEVTPWKRNHVRQPKLEGPGTVAFSVVFYGIDGIQKSGFVEPKIQWGIYVQFRHSYI